MIYERSGQKIVFVRVPKTGGAAIDYCLSSLGFESQPFKNIYSSSDQYLTYNELQRSIRKTDSTEAMDMEDYFTFSFVRNPYARVVSLWQSWNESSDKMNFEPWVMSVQKMLEDDLYAYDSHLRPQTDFLSPHTNRIGRYENLTGDFISILSDMGIYKPDFFVALTNENSDYHKWYNEDTRNVVLQLYHSDLAQFNYGFKVNA